MPSKSEFSEGADCNCLTSEAGVASSLGIGFASNTFARAADLGDLAMDSWRRGGFSIALFTWIAGAFQTLR